MKLGFLDTLKLFRDKLCHFNKDISSIIIDIMLPTGPCTYKRRELATSLETRTRFPELVVQEEKRVRFVVVNGLDIVEKPNGMPIEDAEW